MMLKRVFVPIAVLSLALAADAAAQSTAPDSAPAIGPVKPDLFKHIIANQKKGEAALDLYERIERVESRKNSRDSAPVSVKIERVIPSGTGMFRIRVGDDGKPGDSAAYRADLEKLARSLAQLVNNAASQRDGLAKYAKKKKDRDELIDATHNAFLFTLIATEPRGNRTLSKYKMEPNPAFKPTTRFTSIFPKVRGFVWIDEASCELARIDGEVTDDISIGLFLGKVYKGSHFMQEEKSTRAATSCRNATNFSLGCGWSVFPSTTSTAANYSPASPSMSVLSIRTTATSVRPRKRSPLSSRNSGMPSWTNREQTAPTIESFRRLLVC